MLTDFVLIQPQYIRFDGLIVEFLWDFLKTFLGWSVDHIIYRDYVANRRSFIYCSLGTCRCLVKGKTESREINACDLLGNAG